MVFLSTGLFAVFTVFSNLAIALASPVSPLNGASVTPRPQSIQVTPPPPHWVAYWDKWIKGETGPPAPSQLTGFDTFILAFLLSSGPADQALEWTLISNATRTSIKSQYASAGIKLMVSAFGSTDTPTTSGQDPTKLAQTMAAFVKTYNLDGIDVDYEDFSAVSAGTAANWLVTFTTVLRQNLPADQFIITHAPVAPWFAQSGSGVYLTVNSQVGSLIDWYNVQFYNQGSLYTDCTSLLQTSGGTFPKSSVFEISAAGVSLNKIVIGKPATTTDARTGFMDANTLATCVQQAKNSSWSAGVMVWQFPHAGPSWIQTVRNLSWPV